MLIHGDGGDGSDSSRDVTDETRPLGRQNYQFELLPRHWTPQLQGAEETRQIMCFFSTGCPSMVGRRRYRCRHNSSDAVPSIRTLEADELTEFGENRCSLMPARMQVDAPDISGCFVARTYWLGKVDVSVQRLSRRWLNLHMNSRPKKMVKS